jgi:ABC-type amino acid transport substrate-binding protein
MMDGKGEDEGGRSALTDADYWEFVNRKTFSRINESTYSERKRQETSECNGDEHNMDGPSIIIGSQVSTSSDISSAQRLKAGAIQEVNTDTGDGGFSAAEKLKCVGALGGDPFGVLRAEVQVSLIEWGSSVGETSEDLTEEEERMVAVVQSSWRSGEEFRREMTLMNMNCLSEDDEDEPWGAEGGGTTRPPSFMRSNSIQATLVEEMPPLPPPVEAIPVEEEEVQRNKVLKRYKIVVFILVMVVIASTVGSALGSFAKWESSLGAEDGPNSPSAELHEPTLLRIQREGVLRCGVAEHKHGLSSRNDISGNFEGMSIDLCTAVAIVAIGMEYKVELVQVTGSTRFTSLNDMDIDLLVYGDTHTMERDFHEKATGVGFQFSDPYIYDGLRFAGLPKAVECADNHDWFGECRDLSICVMAASTHEAILHPLLPRQKLRPMVTHDEYLQAFMNGTCSVMAGEQNQIAQVRVQARGYKGEYSYGKKQLSKEPLAMVTRKYNHGDEIWSDTCNLVLKALIYAEKHNVTQHNARFKLSAVPFISVVETVGNYAEMYSRRMEQVRKSVLSETTISFPLFKKVMMCLKAKLYIFRAHISYSHTYKLWTFSRLCFLGPVISLACAPNRYSRDQA